MSTLKTRPCAWALAVAIALGVSACSTTGPLHPAAATRSGLRAGAPAPATPIRHLVVLFDENVSFDHYFATYPSATNPPGEPAFHAAPDTPRVNGLRGLWLDHNPNLNPANGAGASNPFRLDRTQAATADQNHGYTAEQQAYDGGRADLFPLHTGTATRGGVGAFGTKGQVMGYFDGNTVTALWNYAQHFALSDNAYTDTYGPSTPGALEVVSGQTNGVRLVHSTHQPFTLQANSYYLDNSDGSKTLISDVDPAYDLCSNPKDQVMMEGRNIGDLLDAQRISWGGFMGGFDLQRRNANGTTGCARSTPSAVVGATILDYIPHHNWFQYFASTANPTHARPASVAAIGHSYVPGTTTRDPANHEYGLNDFFAAVEQGNFPAVSFLKAPAYQDAHAGYSDPLDEQAFVTKVVNFLEQQPQWKDTAVIVTYDDSDGWYDHAFATPTNPSYDPQADQLDGGGVCGNGTPRPGLSGHPVNGRCGPGTRIPLLVISPWARPDHVGHTRVSLASVVRFIEDNWLHGQRLGAGSFDASAGSLMDLFRFPAREARASSATPDSRLFLDPRTGTVLRRAPAGSRSPTSS